MCVFVAFAPDNRQVGRSDEGFTHESNILLEVDDVWHLVAVYVSDLDLLAVCSLEYVLPLGVSHSTCDEYVLSVREASRAVVEHRREVKAHAAGRDDVVVPITVQVPCVNVMWVPLNCILCDLRGTSRWNQTEHCHGYHHGD